MPIFFPPQNYGIPPGYILTSSQVMSEHWVSIGLDNGLVPIWHQAIIQTNADLLPLPKGKGYVFISVGLSENFRTVPAWNKEHYGIFWGRLFQPWLDCFTILKLGAMEVCALRVLLVINKTSQNCIQWKFSQFNAFVKDLNLTLSINISICVIWYKNNAFWFHVLCPWHSLESRFLWQD